MCQYDPRCPTGRHKPGTVCPYRRTTPIRPSAAPLRPATTVHTPKTAPRYGGSAAASGLGGFDLLAIIGIAAIWDRYHELTGWVGVVFIVILLLLPFAIAYWLTSTCTAWNGTVDGRCKKHRPGIRRCELTGHGRALQLVTLPEAAAALSLIVGVANVAIVLGAALS